MLRKFALFFLTCALFVPMAVLGQSKTVLPKINVKEYQLKNGLKVVLHQDDSTPIVSVNVFYHVGSKNESPGKTGFAHLFEHMMFQGSKNYEVDYLSSLSEAGASVNGTTNEDRTYYYETVPSNFLELALYLEADRMGNLLDAMSQEKLDNQRDVVKNERRQRVDNVPGGTASERILEVMYPKEHPYSWDVIGSMSDLSAASMDDVKGFFRTYYVPNNAVLAIAGKFDEKQARAWIEKYFGPIAKGADVKKPTPTQPTLSGEVRKTYEDTVPLPRLYMVWHGVPQDSPDDAALSILGSILSGGRSSRLQSNLNYGKELVQQVGAFNGSNELAGMFQISATARPQKSLTDIEKEINIEIERIKNEPPTTEEINRAVNGIEANSIFRLQTVLGKGGQLASNAGFKGKADTFQADLDEYRKLTPADIQRVAKKYLTGNRLVMTYLPSKNPAPRTNAADNKPTTASGGKKVDEARLKAQKAALPKPGPNPTLVLPKIEKTKLSNGLNVWVVNQNELPIVSMNLVLNAGATLDSADKTGVAAMTANMLNQGTKTRSVNDIANQLQEMGSNVNAGAGWDGSNVSMQTLTKNLDKTLDIYADVLLNPAFPADELERTRRRVAGQFLQQKSNPTFVSNVVYNKVLYGNQPYGRQLSGDEKSIKAMSRDDLVKFYDSYYRPNNATLIVVGDVTTKTLVPQLEKAFAGWKAGGTTAPTTPVPAEYMGQPGIYIVDKPGAAQSSVSIGQVGISRDNPDYYAVQVMNAVLGGGSSGRLFMNLREDKGYTYGAYSSFNYRRSPGPFSASAEIQTGSTKEAVAEFMKELKGIRGDIPVTAADLETNKQSLIRRYPAGFETVQQISGQLSNLVTYGLPDTYFNDYINKVNAVTLADVNRVANKYLTPDKMAIVIVGDRKVIEAKLKELGYGITILDAEGNKVAE
ncbi:MAG TPA: insulinase family protein [Pyrinomonadaceae bacterium]|nr:insulinase family protein [Pyrinomonadaceae bacterium]